MLHKRALRQSQSYRSLRKGTTIGCNSMRVLRQYACGQRNIAGDDHVSSNDLLCDPIVGDVGSRAHDYPRYQRGWRDLHKAVGHYKSLQPKTSGDIVGFLLYGASVSVDVDLDHIGYLFRKVRRLDLVCFKPVDGFAQSWPPEFTRPWARYCSAAPGCAAGRSSWRAYGARPMTDIA